MLTLTLVFLSISLGLGYRAIRLTPVYLTTPNDERAEASAAASEYAFWAFWLLTVVSAFQIR